MGSTDIVFYIYDICFYLEGAVIVTSHWTSQLCSRYLKTISLDALCLRKRLNYKSMYLISTQLYLEIIIFRQNVDFGITKYRLYLVLKI